jgi:hypothetical protein
MISSSPDDYHRGSLAGEVAELPPVAAWARAAGRAFNRCRVDFYFDYCSRRDGISTECGPFDSSAAKSIVTDSPSLCTAGK